MNTVKLLIKKLLIKTIFIFVKVYNPYDTLRIALEKGYSFVRIGDGELLWMGGVKLDSFEKFHSNMSYELRQIWKMKNILVCVNSQAIMKNHKKPNNYYNTFIYDYWKLIIKTIPKCGFFGDACFTRYWIEKQGGKPYLFYNTFKQLMKNKRVLIVEGYGAKNGVGNDLFEKAILVKRILCPDKYAYSVIEQIEKAINEVVDQYDILCFGVGPTGKCLIYRIFNKNIHIRCYDIGFLDTDYMHFINSKNTFYYIEEKTIFSQVKTNEVIKLDYDKNEYKKQILIEIR